MSSRVASGEEQGRRAAWASSLPRAVAVLLGLQFVALGAWAMVEPRSFFDVVATFEPFNQHFLQDIGAFQLGLGAVLLLAGWRPRADALVMALVGVGLGAALHAVSHLIGRDLGGKPETDIPSLAAMAAMLLVAGILRWRRRTAA
jgi:uncharacterized membrane protein